MAMSSYGSYRSRKRKMIVYYIIAAAVVAAAVILFFSSPSENKTNQQASPEQPAETAGHTQPEKDLQKAPDFSSVVAEADGLAGPQVMALLKEAQKDIDETKFIGARDILNDVLNMAMDANLREQVKKQMSSLANEWLFSRTVHFGDNLCSTYKVQPGDILANIATKYKVPYQFLMEINNIRSEKSLQAGQVIKTVNGPFHAIVYRSSFIMDLYLQNVYVKSYRVGLGKDGHETPPGLWRAKIGGKLIKPTWTDPETGKTYHANDPDYPLGSGWIELEGIDSRTRGIEGIAFHGTKDEATIGTKSSRGCIRLYNGELVELYDMFEPGHSELRVVD